MIHSPPFHSTRRRLHRHRRLHRRRRCPSALTLIEVVASLALLGGLLVSAMLATTAHGRQSQSAKRMHRGVEMLDRIMNRWAVRDFDAEQLWQALQAESMPVATSAAWLQSQRLPMPEATSTSQRPKNSSTQTRLWVRSTPTTIASIIKIRIEVQSRSPDQRDWQTDASIEVATIEPLP